MKEYKFRKGANNYGVKPEIIGQELEALKNIFGVITPKRVVDKAREESNPLHSCFEWNDSIAGEKFRENQARKMIGDLVITIKDVEGYDPTPQRAFVNIRDSVQPFSKGSIFISIMDAIADPISREYLLARAYRDMEIFVKKYEDYREFSDLILLMKEKLQERESQIKEN